MPYKSEKISINCPFLDRRTKLLPCQKEMVIFNYNQGMGIRAIAKIFKVDRRGIQFIIFPERLAKNLQDRENRGGSMQYYDRSYNNEQQKVHRRYKHKLYKEKIIR